MDLTVSWGDTVLDRVRVRPTGLRTLGGPGTGLPSISIPLDLEAPQVFKVGALTIRATASQGAVPIGSVDRTDWSLVRVFCISLMSHAFFVIAALITPKDRTSPIDELYAHDVHFLNAILKREPEQPKPKTKLAKIQPRGRGPGLEGAIGQPNRPEHDAAPSRPGAQRVDPTTREENRRIALRAGLLGALADMGNEQALSNVFGPGGIGDGINEAMGGLKGATVGDAGGAGGLGSRGTGSGGGGHSLGIGGLGNGGRGHGASCGECSAQLAGGGLRGGSIVKRGKLISVGGLSHEEIARAIRPNLPRFKYCYEKELNKSPNLAGKVSVYFTIAPSGQVAEASVRETSIDERTVEDCVLSVMRSIQFPKPKGGGIVVVTYPFIFATN